MARDCPECSAPVDGLSCRSCGWSVAPQRGVPADRDRWLCADWSRGQRCAKVGVYTMSTQGAEQWYCPQHFEPFRKWGEKTEPMPTEIKEVFRQYKPLDAEALRERLAIQAEGQ